MIVSLGVEDELQVVDALTGALAPFDIRRAERALLEGSGAITCEIHRCTVELQTPICTSPDAIVVSLSSLRGFARKQAASEGQGVLAAGLHPFSPWQSQPVYDDAEDHPTYAWLLEEYGDIARGGLSFGLHVHLGLPDAKLRIPVLNGLRSVLPDVLALSASSPFHEGRDTGLASWRHSVLGRYPRMGIPDAWPDEKAYFDHIERLRRVGSILPYQGMWDDLRLHHRYGTLEVRICDAVASLDRIWLIVALLQCEAMVLAEEAAHGSLPEPEPRLWIEENKWRARRYGLNASLVDWRRDEAASIQARFDRWLARLFPVAKTLGLWPRLEVAVAAAFLKGTEADQQRRWRNEGGSFESLVRSLIAASAEPWTAASPVSRIHSDSQARNSEKVEPPIKPEGIRFSNSLRS
ncbi:MAG: YbdK family carboxylate-amine ligase [Proteobacteria bacterium]|nr:YbdK family carboxylate-amine ligase [Pseudomonadota bacterium]